MIRSSVNSRKASKLVYEIIFVAIKTWPFHLWQSEKSCSSDPSSGLQIDPYHLVNTHKTPIAQREISMSVAFPTHVWKMPNICKCTIVRLFSHMYAFSRTYVLKSKHVWKKAPRCKYTNVFVFFQTSASSSGFHPFLFWNSSFLFLGSVSLPFRL